jgi:hypothetical protein
MKPLVVLVSLLWVPAAIGAAATYSISIDTSALAGSSAGPFSISFQMSDGSGTGDGNNLAILTNFQFGGGSPAGTANLVGTAFGNLSSGVIMTDGSGVAFFSQQFLAGSTVRFQLSLTTNVDTGPTADAFTVAILDKTLTPIPTTEGAPLDMLVEIDINSANPAVTLYQADLTRSPAAGGSPITFAPPQSPTLLPCDPNNAGYTNVTDVQTFINEILGVASAANDLNHDGVVNVTDLQLVVNAALGLGCTVL